MAVDAVGANRALLVGKGIDWGSGSGVLTIAAAKIPTVEFIVGLELAEEDVIVAQANAVANGVANKVAFIRADSFEPFSRSGSGPARHAGGRGGFLDCESAGEPRGLMA